MKFIIRMVLSAVAVIVGAYILPGVRVDGFWAAFIVAIIMAILNGTLKPILTAITIPLTILTLGLFLLVINALMVMLADWFVSGFYVDGFWWALIMGLVLAILNAFFSDLREKG